MTKGDRILYTLADAFIRLGYVILALWAAFVFLDGLATFGIQEGAPQQAAVAAWMAARVIAPYVILRSMEKAFGVGRLTVVRSIEQKE